jgi:hypothetical protein
MKLIGQTRPMTSLVLTLLTFTHFTVWTSSASIVLSPDGSLRRARIETVKASCKAVETTVQVKLCEVASGRKTQSLKVSSGPTQFGVRGPSASLAFSGGGACSSPRTCTISLSSQSVTKSRSLLAITS